MKKEVLLILLLLIPIALAHGDGDGHDEALERNAESVAEEISQERIRTAGFLIAGLGVILAAASIMYGMTKKKSWPKIVTYVVIIVIILLIGFSLYYFKTTASETTGITVCENNQCFWAAHVHSELHIELCDDVIELGLEKGDLGRVHTHKEKNRLHFHERLPVDPVTKEISDTNDIQLHTFFEGIGMTFNSSCINNKCNDDMCGNTKGSLTMLVNNRENKEFEKYAFQEGDNIQIIFR
jgi:type IV secretory pathway VirB2 component (pilin)